MPHNVSPSPRHTPRVSFRFPAQPSASSCQSMCQDAKSPCDMLLWSQTLQHDVIIVNTLLIVIFIVQCASKNTNNMAKKRSRRGGAPSQGGVPRRPQRIHNPSTHKRDEPSPSVLKHAGPSSQHSEPTSVPQASCGRQICFARLLLGEGGCGTNPSSQVFRPSEAANTIDFQRNVSCGVDGIEAIHGQSFLVAFRICECMGPFSCEYGSLAGSMTPQQWAQRQFRSRSCNNSIVPKTLSTILQ
jgi:hypothetical protein